MNKVVLMGRLTRDPDIRYTQGAEPMCVAKYTLAVDRRGRKRDGEQSADFISCTAFGKSGEFAEKYLHKGIKICLSGHIQTGSYTKQDGTKVYTTDVIVEDQEFCESKASAEIPAPSSAPQTHSRAAQPRQSDLSDFMSIPDGLEEELPFN